jgi:hypothetical protein
MIPTAAQRLPFFGSLSGFLPFPKQFFAGLGYEGLCLGYRKVVIARLDGDQKRCPVRKNRPQRRRDGLGSRCR